MANHNVSLQWTNAGSLVTEPTETINNVVAGDTITFTVTTTASVFGRMFAPAAHENNSYWNNTGAFISAPSGSFAFVYTIPSSLSSSGLYSFYFTFSFNPSLTNRTVQPVQINFASSLTAPDISLATPAASGAVGNTVNLSATNTGGAVDTWTWTENSGAGTLTGSSNTATYVWPDNIGANRTASITVEAENTEGTDSVTITLTQNDIDTVLTGSQTVTFDDDDDTVSFTLGSLEVGTQLRVLRNPSSGDSLVGATTITSTSQTFTTKDLQTGNNGGAFDPTEVDGTQLYTPQVRVNSSDAWVSTTGGNITLSKQAVPSGGTIEFDIEYDSETASNTFIVTGTFSGSGTSASPFLVSPGDTVTFENVGAAGVIFQNATITSFNSTYWDSTSVLTVNKGASADNTIKSTLAYGVSFTATIDSAGPGSPATRSVYFRRVPVYPDTTVSHDGNKSIGGSDTSFTVTVTEVSPDSNSSVTQYGVSTTATGNPTFTRTGPGSISVTGQSVPSFGTRTYYLKARVTTANNGTGTWVTVDTFTVTWATGLSPNAPAKDSYGIAIYDDEGTFVTSFTEASFVPREIFSGTATTSISGTVDVALTGLSGVTSANSFAVVSGGTSINIATTFVDGNKLRLARDTVATAVDVTVIQYVGPTITSETNPDYGFEIRNGDGDVVIDSHAPSCYAVKEIVNIGNQSSSLSGTSVSVVNAVNQPIVSYTITLPQGRYPSSGGLPIPAISYEDGNQWLRPPVVSSVTHSDGSYRTISGNYPAGTTGSKWRVAILTERNGSPSYYGGSASGYGVQVFDSDDNVIWDSEWEQVIGNNVIPINGTDPLFSSGTDQNGTYDVDSGADGVSAPFKTSSQEQAELITFGETVNITGLNAMDPANSYLLGGNIAFGRVQRYRGTLLADSEVDQESGQSGGGTHEPAIRITGTTTAQATMYRTGVGPLYTNATDAGGRHPDSFHPGGYFVIVRITD